MVITSEPQGRAEMVAHRVERPTVLRRTSKLPAINRPTIQRFLFCLAAASV
jgi:hypothetical protein